MTFELSQNFPAYLNTDDGDPTGDTRKLLEILQAGVDELWDLIDSYALTRDPDFAPTKAVDLMLLSAGNPFPVAYNLTLAQRRKIVKLLVPIYLEKGTEQGIENAARILTGIEVRVVSPPTIDAWILGVSVLGDGTVPAVPSLTDEAVLGQSHAFTYRSFQLEVDRALSDEEREVLQQIAEVMKPVNTHYAGIVEPSAGTDIEHWELDISELEIESDLH